MKEKITEIIQLQQIRDPRGNLTVAEELIHVPFSIGHIEWLHPFGCTPLHLPPTAKMMVAALAGEITLEIKDSSPIRLCHSDQGVVVREKAECCIREASEGSVVLLIY